MFKTDRYVNLSNKHKRHQRVVKLRSFAALMKAFHRVYRAIIVNVNHYPISSHHFAVVIRSDKFLRGKTQPVYFNNNVHLAANASGLARTTACQQIMEI